jgi:cutinase
MRSISLPNDGPQATPQLAFPRSPEDGLAGCGSAFDKQFTAGARAVGIAVIRHAFSQVLHAHDSRSPVEVTETRREKSGRPAVAVAHGPRSVPIMQIVEAAADRCEPLWLVDPDARRHRRHVPAAPPLRHGHRHQQLEQQGGPARSSTSSRRFARAARSASARLSNVPTRSSGLDRRLPPYVNKNDVSARQIARFLGAAVLTICAMLNAAVSIPSTAAAAPCPNNEVVFARGSDDPPGVGIFGQAFVDSLRPQVGGRSLGVYAVNYPATNKSNELANSASAGAKDASAHVEYMAANCPDTRMVLGGYSLGAAVIDLITATRVPPQGGIPAPMPPEVAHHVAAVAVFGNPWVRSLGAPLTAISPLYGAKAIDLCNPGDPICSDGGDMSAHIGYVRSGMVNQAASFAASRL